MSISNSCGSSSLRVGRGHPFPAKPYEQREYHTTHIKTMTPEQKQIAIAEACGWVNCISPHADEYHFLTDLELGLAMGAPVGRNRQLYSDGLHYAISNYLNDLNAMHEAVSIFDYDQADEFDDHLCDICKKANDLADNPTPWRFAVTNATAAQRAEAFLRTLNLWKDDA
jgi:hypothetical protein